MFLKVTIQQQLLKTYPELKKEMMESAFVDTLMAERSAVREAARLGFDCAIAPLGAPEQVDGLKVIGLSSVQALIDTLQGD